MASEQTVRYQELMFRATPSLILGVCLFAPLTNSLALRYNIYWEQGANGNFSDAVNWREQGLPGGPVPGVDDTANFWGNANSQAAINEGDDFSVLRLTIVEGKIVQNGGALRIVDSTSDPLGDGATSGVEIGGRLGGVPVGTATYSLNRGLLSVNSRIRIGAEGGTGVMTVSGTASLQVGSRSRSAIVIGDAQGYSGSRGTLTLRDSATVTSGSEFWVGYSNGYADTNGTLNIMDQAALRVSNWFVIGRDDAHGVMNMSGGTLIKDGSGNFLIAGGYQSPEGNGVLNQTGGTIDVQRGEVWLGEAPNSVGTWNASGGNAKLGAVYVGYYGSGEWNISDTADIVATDVTLARGGTGKLHLMGGTLTANALRKGSGAGSIQFDGGILRAGADSTSFIDGFGTADVAILQGGLRIDTNSHHVTISQQLTGSGGLQKLGDGALRLSAITTFLGQTTVSAGQLQIDAAGALDGSSLLLVEAGAALELAGTISLNDHILLVLNAGSKLSLDFSGTEVIGALEIDGTFLAAGTYTLEQLQMLDSNVSFLGSPDSALQVMISVPEPATIAMISVGIVAIIGLRRRAL